MDDTDLAEFLESLECEQFALVAIGGAFNRQLHDAPAIVDLKVRNFADAQFQRCVVDRYGEIYPISRSARQSRLVHYFNENSETWEINAPLKFMSDKVTFGLFCNFGPSKMLALVCVLSRSQDAQQKIANFHHFGLNLLSASRFDVNDDGDGILTKGERRVLIWCAKGKTSFEISKIIDLSQHTVNHYLNSAVKKLEASNRTHAVAKAIVEGIIVPSDLE